MKIKKIALMLSFLVILFSGFACVQAFNIYGYTYNVTGGAINNTNVSIGAYVMAAGSPPVLVTTFSTTSNASGWYNLSGVTANTSWMYKPVIKHYNGTNVDYIGQTLPAFPYGMFLPISTSPTTFYIKEAVGINVTAHNNSGDAKDFQYMMMDESLGVDVESHFTSYVSQYTFWVPKDKNYSITIYPNMSMPTAYSMNNTSLYSAGDLINLPLNITDVPKRVSGYAAFNGAANFSNMTVIAYMYESGGMVSDSHPMPYNMSAWLGSSDVYNLTTGFYNISVFTKETGIKILLMAHASNGSSYAANYHNISITSGSANAEVNFTLRKLSGTAAVINITNSMGGTKIVNTVMKNFVLSNETGDRLGQAHVEVEVNYTNYNGTYLKWMKDVDQNDNGTFTLPAYSAPIKSIQIFSQKGGAPRKLSISAAELVNDYINITLYNFNPGGINSTQSVNVIMYKSSTACDVPAPGTDCNITSTESAEAFSPIKALISGGDVSFRMIDTGNNLTIHYVNVNLIASGPPDAMFDANATNSTYNGSTLEELWRLGSKGPDIYNHIIAGTPYNPNYNVSTLRLHIPKFYDDDWNVVWDIAVNGTNSIPAEYVDYNSTLQYRPYINGTGMDCSNTTDENLTGMCYADTTNHIVWFKLLHFSGTGTEQRGVDIVAPNVSSVSPANESNTAGLSADISVTFSETMNDSTVTNSTFYVLGFNGSISTTDNVTFSLDLNTNFIYSKEYQVNITTGVKDVAGNAMAAVYTWNFTTQAQPAGGGGTPTGTVAVSTTKSIDFSENKEQTLTMVQGDRATFTAAGGGHTVHVKSIAGSIVTISISSEYIEVTLAVNKPQYVDLTGNGVDNLKVTLKSVKGGVADITFEDLDSVSETGEDTTTSSAQATTSGTTESRETPTSAVEATQTGDIEMQETTTGLLPWAGYIVILLIIGMLLGFVYTYVRKKK